MIIALLANEQVQDSAEAPAVGGGAAAFPPFLAHVQMARELGLNPRKLGGIDNHRQQPWKAPLPVFIENLYEKGFGRRRPERVRSIEEMVRERRAKKEARKARKKRRAEEAEPRPS